MKKIKYNDYICSDCARNKGAEWPEGHVATFHTGKCKVCREEAGVCAVSDWNWQDDLSLQVNREF